MRMVEGKACLNERRETLASCIKEETTVSRELDRKKITVIKRRTLETSERKEKGGTKRIPLSSLPVSHF